MRLEGGARALGCRIRAYYRACKFCCQRWRRAKGGGCEIMIVLEEEVMERLREDEVWTKYTEAR